MAWVRVDDALTEHPKIVSAGPLALIVHMRALCYASRNLTDGNLPAEIIGSFCWDLEEMAKAPMPALAAKLAEALCEANLWHPNGSGYVIHDYLRYNFSRQQVQERRELRASSGRIGGVMSGKSRRSLTKQTVKQTAKQNDSKTEPPSPSPSPSPVEEKKIGLVLSSPNSWGTPERLMELYNRLVPPGHPKVSRLTPARRKKAQKYLTMFPEERFWTGVFSAIQFSSFLRGLRPSNGHEGFKGDFDWLLTQGKDGTENAIKVEEGRYADAEAR